MSAINWILLILLGIALLWAVYERFFNQSSAKVSRLTKQRDKLRAEKEEAVFNAERHKKEADKYLDQVRAFTSADTKEYVRSAYKRRNKS